MWGVIVIALFRNFNQGQSGTPRATELISTFRSLGADDARPVRANGTVAVRAQDPQAVVANVRGEIAAHSSWSDIVIVRTAEWMEQLGGRLQGCAPTTEVAFFDSPRAFPYAVPWRSSRGRLTVRHADASHAICVNDEPRTSDATPTLEQLLGLPATSRGADTVIRATHAVRQLR